MKYHKRTLGIILLIFLISCQTNKESIFPNEKQIVQIMDDELVNSDLKGVVAIGINKQGEHITYSNGNSVWDEDAPITPNHIFRLASMTKLITSIAALQLVEQGKLELDEDLSSIMPEMSKIPILSNGELKSPGNKITLRNLLTHTSGFGYFFTDEQLSKFDKSNWEEEDLPRRFESGTNFLYGTSTDWVGKLVEKVSDKNLEEYIRSNITKPLKMDRTFFNVPDSLKNAIVSYGRRGDDGTKALNEFPNRIPEQNTSDYSGGGGLFSTPDDYTKLLSCILNDGQFDGGQLITKETIDEMFKNQIGDLVLDIENNYFLVGLCCDFKGLIKKSSKWGLAGLIDMEPTSYGRMAGTLLWGGAYNTFFFIDRESGIAASIYTQHLPFNHPATTELFEKFSEQLYLNTKK